MFVRYTKNIVTFRSDYRNISFKFMRIMYYNRVNRICRWIMIQYSTVKILLINSGVWFFDIFKTEENLVWSQRSPFYWIISSINRNFTKYLRLKLRSHYLRAKSKTKPLHKGLQKCLVGAMGTSGFRWCQQSWWARISDAVIKAWDGSDNAGH